MLEQYDVSPIIDLNPRRSKQFTYKEMDINLDGVPVCPLGRKMIDWGVEKKHYRCKWRCPAVVGKWECPNPCSDSSYGRFHTSTKNNPRLFHVSNVIVKNGENVMHFVLVLNAVSNAKKSITTWKAQMGEVPVIGTYIIAMCQQTDAWVKEMKKNNFIGLNNQIKSILAI